MKPSALLASLLFALAITALAVLVSLLIAKKTWKRWPFFSLYCAWDLLAGISAYILMRFYPPLYVKGYFIEVSGDTLLEFCVLIEISWAALNIVQKTSKKTFLSLIAVFFLLGAAVWPLAGISAASFYPPEFLLLLHLSRTTALLRILVFLILAACSQVIGISWRGRELQIATGLGLYSMANLCVTMLHSRGDFGLNPDGVQRMAEVVGLLCLFYWVYCFSRAEARFPAAPPQSAAVLENLGRQAQAEREAAIRLLKE